MQSQLFIFSVLTSLFMQPSPYQAQTHTRVSTCKYTCQQTGIKKKAGNKHEDLKYVTPTQQYVYLPKNSGGR